MNYIIISILSISFYFTFLKSDDPYIDLEIKSIFKPSPHYFFARGIPKLKQNDDETKEDYLKRIDKHLDDQVIKAFVHSSFFVYHCKCQDIEVFKPTLFASKSQDRVLDGCMVVGNHLPYVVSILSVDYPIPASLNDAHKTEKALKTYTPFCTGTILNNHFVITAGTCAETMKPQFLSHYRIIASGKSKQLKVMLEEVFNGTKVNKTNELRTIKNIYFPYGFQKRVKNEAHHYHSADIALLEINPPFPFTNDTGLDPACLINSFLKNLTIFPGQLAAAGWGECQAIAQHPSAQNKNPKNKPRNYKIDLTNGTNSLFIANLKQETGNCDFDTDQICAYSKTSGLCTSDIGAPLLHFYANQTRVIGIFNGNIPETFKDSGTKAYECASTIRGRFTLIAPHLTFLYGHLKVEQCHDLFN